MNYHNLKKKRQLKYNQIISEIETLDHLDALFIKLDRFFDSQKILKKHKTYETRQRHLKAYNDLINHNNTVLNRFQVLHRLRTLLEHLRTDINMKRAIDARKHHLLNAQHTIDYFRDLQRNRTYSEPP